MADREFDLIVYGATGFTGRLVCEHILDRAPEGLRWALAGRSEDKLRGVADDLGTDVPLVIADSDDRASVEAMAARTRVVCTTVGPYALHGTSLVAACAEAGTDYCDLTGEVPWMREMIDTHQDAARRSGARIVFSCGFDSIPSDLGTWFAQQQMMAHHAVHSPAVHMRLKAARGAASGGTVASMLNQVEAATRDRETRRVLFDPWALQPAGERTGPGTSDAVMPTYDRDFDAWTGPFVMAMINLRVVRRSNALLGYPWGREFRYDEAVLLGGGPLGAVKAGALTGAMGIGMAGLAVGPIRRLATRFLPSSGEGPSAEARRRGFFDIRLLAEHPTDRSKDVMVRVLGDRDPGYGSTAKMLGESALSLAAGESEVEGGMWTPASALGQPLRDRLQRYAGVTFEVI
ncbi:trans-acting enoyl reductase family protein [Euzebya sp.]|uniref:saccharopine dehydrogenase family protein n=1 Tax=Euzebya sp. TaxID=1971409 RepID=UPI00351482C2